MSKRKIVIPLVVIQFFLLVNLYASSGDIIDERIGEQNDLVAIKLDQLDRLSYDVLKENSLADKTRIIARKRHISGCSKGFKKLGALSIGLIQGAVGALGTGVFAVAETVILDLSYFGIHLKGSLDDPYEHTKKVANETNEVVSLPFNGLSDKQCSELKKLIKESAEKQEATHKRHVEIQETISKVQAISQVPRAAIKDEYVHNITAKVLNSNGERDIARSR